MEAKFDGSDFYQKIKSLTGAGLDAIAEPAMTAGGKVFKKLFRSNLATANRVIMKPLFGKAVAL